MLVSPDQLRLLALIRRHGSLAGAADALGLTPAAVSGQLSRVERGLRSRLVQRGPRGAELTDAGQVLARFGERIDELCQDAERAVAAQLPILQSHLRVGTFQSAAQHLLPPALTALRHRNAEARITVAEIASVDGARLVAQGHLDVAVTAEYAPRQPVPDGVRVFHLLDDPIVVCLPDDHPLAHSTEPHQPLRLSQLRSQPWIAIEEGQPARAQFDQAVSGAGFTPTLSMETANYAVAQALVGTGIACALLSRLTIAPTPGATFRPLTRPRLSRRIQAVTRTDSAWTPLVEQAVDILHQVASQLTQEWQ